MKPLTYFLGFLTVALFLLLVSSGAKADVLDPKIALGPTGSCMSMENNPLQETSLTQSFSGLQTGCINDFQNEIGRGGTLDKLVVNVTSSFLGTISCGFTQPAPFNAFTASATACTFFERTGDSEHTDDSECEDSEECGGIGHGVIYGLSFDSHFGDTVDITLSQQVITPEPATLLLFGTGVIAYVANKKRLNVAKQSL